MTGQKASPVLWVGLVVLILLSALWALVLPPRQTADFVGIGAAVLAHGLTAGTLDRLFSRRQGTLLTVGVGMTVSLYWLGAVGTALLFRLLRIPATGILILLELCFVAAAGLAVYGFWLARRLDPDRPGLDPDHPGLDPDRPGLDPDRPGLDQDHPWPDGDRKGENHNEK